MNAFDNDVLEDIMSRIEAAQRLGITVKPTKYGFGVRTDGDMGIWVVDTEPDEHRGKGCVVCAVGATAIGLSSKYSCVTEDTAVYFSDHFASDVFVPDTYVIGISDGFEGDRVTGTIEPDDHAWYLRGVEVGLEIRKRLGLPPVIGVNWSNRGYTYERNR